MARTTEQIYNALTARYVVEMNSIGVLVDPSTWSQTNLQRLLFFVVAYVFKTIEEMFDQHKIEIDATIAAMKPHSLQWYAVMQKKFQYGYDLVADADYYDNTGLTDAQITASKIVAYSAVTEMDKGIRIKVAKTVGNDLGKLAAEELNALRNYNKRIKDAGVYLGNNYERVTSDDPDSLKLSVRIKYNALVLNQNGQRIDGTSQTPIQEAIRTFLKNLPFNGVFSVSELLETIKAVPGVSDAKIDLVQVKYGALPFTSVDIDYTPDSGYLRIVDADLLIQFLAA